MKNIGWGKVKTKNDIGAMLVVQDSEVFVARTEQLGPMDIGEDYLILFWKDESGDKLLGSEKITEHSSDVVPEETYFKNQKLTGYIYQETPHGFNVWFDGEYRGVIYKNEIFGDYPIGKEITVFVKTVRPDHKVDLSLQPIGYRFAAKGAQALILEKLAAAGGHLALSDKSSPEEISKILGMSKKKFKNAIGGLYKQKKILIQKDGIKQV